MASPEYHIIASQLFSTISYVASYFGSLSIPSYFLAFVDIKAFTRSYSQITAACWPRLFCNLGVFVQHIATFCQECYSVVLYLVTPLQRYITIKDINATLTISSSQQLHSKSLTYNVYSYILKLQLQSEINTCIYVQHSNRT